MVIDGVDFDGLAPGHAARRLHRLKGRDMLYHFSVLILVVAAMFVADVSPFVSVAVQYFLIFIAITNIEASHSRRLDAWLDGFGRSMSGANQQGGEA